MDIWIRVRKKEVIIFHENPHRIMELLIPSSFRSKTVTEGNSNSQFS